MPESTAVSDTATLSGANASTATGTVTYSVYSNSGCATAVGTGTAQNITTAGHAAGLERGHARHSRYVLLAGVVLGGLR